MGRFLARASKLIKAGGAVMILMAAAGAGGAQVEAQVEAQTGSRPAISSKLSSNDVARAFVDAVVAVCVPAVTGGRTLGATPPVMRRGVETATEDPALRRQADAAPGDVVWDVTAARGVVLVREHDGHCIVSAYGPGASATYATLAQALQEEGYDELVPTPGLGVRGSLVRARNGRRVQVLFEGHEPGNRGHRSRFSVLIAQVFATNG